ncbi:MAG: VWA domain-containing protein [Haloplanus sp.]
MTDEFDISRRKALAALGTIGVASAGAGLGTSAYFSDQETFQNNQLTAGTLDMKVDWEEHYSDWSDDEVNNPAEGNIDATMSQPGTTGDYYAFPAGAPSEEKSVWVNRTDSIGPNGESSLQLFMDNTALEAYPDANDDGVQDDFAQADVCTSADILADAPDDMDPTANDRTRSADTYDDEAGEPLSLINLDDVKPGDFGELTFSFHICTNPGYVWMNAANVSAAENGVTEPEADDPDESGPANEDTTDIANAQVELLDEIQTALWYDTNCNNLVDGDGGAGAQVCVQLVLDSSGSMSSTDNDSKTRNQELISGAETLAEGILNANPDNRVGVVDFDDDATTLLSVGSADAQNLSAIETQIENIDADGGTDIAAGINEADDDLSNCPESSQTIQIVVTDGQSSDPSTAADNAVGSGGNTDEIFAVGTGGATETSLQAFARPQNDEHTFLTQQGESLEDLLSQLGGQILAGEQVFVTQSLRETLEDLTSGNGIPLDGDTSQGEFDELNDDPAADTRQCFPGNATQCIGFSWWLPVDHGNEVQSDSVTFDLGFYTEQCRHNDGAGMNNAAVNNDEVDA